MNRTALEMAQHAPKWGIGAGWKSKKRQKQNRFISTSGRSKGIYATGEQRGACKHNRFYRVHPKEYEAYCLKKTGGINVAPQSNR